MIESGIYEQWMKEKVFDQTGELRDKLWKQDNVFDWNVIHLIKISGVFKLWLTGICVSLTIFSINFVIKHFLLKRKV